ncbi:T9SS type A sorting domain-containing protein [bacterium]|nr:T9SS type A sorting domain-containing protein [bacterium]
MKRVLLTLLFSLSALAQWPTDPAQNLLICNHSGEQAIPKIAALSEGGCYITWQDQASGNYDVYLQRLDANGVPQWATPCGILISNHPQDTWLTDWDMAVDASDNCIIAVNDIRSGGDRDITVYSIGPQQEFLWGPDGIALSNNDGFEPDPRIAPMDNGDVVFAWQEENMIHLRRLNMQGQDVFTPAVITITATNGVSIPRVAAADSSSVILSYLVHQGSQFTSPRHIYLQKYSHSGAAMWPAGGVAVMTTNGIGIQMRPDVIYDGAGGAYSFWYDTRNNVHHVFAQRVNAAGSVMWTANGVQVDLTANELQMSPSAVLAGNGIAVFYQTANSNQSMGGLDAQLLSGAGDILWNVNGATIAQLSPEPCFNVRAHMQGNNFGVFYSQYAPGSALNTLLRASQLNPAGQPTWTPPITDLCTVVSEKGRPYTTVNPFGQIIAAWPDSRTATMDIYLQNVNSNGSLGPNTQLPPEIHIVSPQDFEIVHSAAVNIIFEVENFLIDPDFGDGFVSVTVNDQDPALTNIVAPYPVTMSPGENLVTLEILDLNFLPLEPPVMDSVHVIYQPRNPSIVITSPATDTVVFHNPVTIYFDVEDFIISDSLGDGHLRVEVQPDIPQCPPFAFEHFSANPVEVTLECMYEHRVILRLVDNDGLPLVPDAADSVNIFFGEISADPLPDALPTNFSITSTYPNPFNSSVAIEYDVPRSAPVALDIYDVTGRKVATLINATHSVGTHRVLWNADSQPSGVYIVSLTSAHTSVTSKLMLVK